MIIDKNQQLHDRAGRYAHKVSAPSSVVLSQPVEDEEMFETSWQKEQRIAEQQFKSKVERTRQFMEQHGKKPSYRRETDEEKTLVAFINKVRVMDKAQTLTEVQRAMLEDLPFPVLGATVAQTREQRFMNVQKFMETHGRTPVSSDPEDTENLHGFIHATRNRSKDAEYLKTIAPLLKHLRPEVAEVLIGKRKMTESAHLNAQLRIDKLLEFLDREGRAPSTYGDAEERTQFNRLASLTNKYRDDPKFLDRLSKHPVFADLPQGVFTDLRLLSGAEIRSAAIGAIKRSLAQKDVDPKTFMSENFTHQYEAMSRYVNTVRRGTAFFEYPEYDKAITKIMGAGWEKRQRPAFHSVAEKVRARELDTIALLREFLNESDGRLPSRYKEGEDALSYKLRALQMKANSGAGMNPETMAELNEILGAGWHELKTRTKKNRKP